MQARSTTDDQQKASLPEPLRRAVEAHQAGDRAGAEAGYRQFLKSEPEHPTALQLLGLLYAEGGAYQHAIALMQASLRLFPEQAEVANNLGNVLCQCGRREEALQYYGRALEIYPGYADALRNQALCHLDLGRLAEARSGLERCLESRPADAAAWLAMGNVRKRQQDPAGAADCYRKTLELKPDYPEAHHNLGICLRLMQKPGAALESYAHAARLGLDRAELHYNRGNALVDLRDTRAAIDAFRAAVQRNPEDLQSHRHLATLIWEGEGGLDHLASYRDALRERPAAVNLRVQYAYALSLDRRLEQAEATLREGLGALPGSAALTSQLAFVLEEQQRWDEALRTHEAAVQLPDAEPDHRTSYARALLARGLPDQALEQAQQAAARTPFNQRALAYLGLCWRLLDDERDAILNDYQRLVRVYEVPYGPQFSGSAEFNERLAGVLDTLHLGKRHPPEQSLRGGTQTYGDLLVRQDPEIRMLAEGLRHCISEYIAAMPADMQHPLASRKSGNFEFSASWSVRLARCGYHVMHVHPLGWISSAYYVAVPGEVTASDACGGGIQFGTPDIDIGPAGEARRRIQPAVGQLVLFPSYMWHGTVPYEADGTRMTVAFDVVPGP